MTLVALKKLFLVCAEKSIKYEFYSLFNNSEKDGETYLKEKADSPPEP
jgi:hypothetical protein